jgi:hypothetical protein
VSTVVFVETEEIAMFENCWTVIVVCALRKSFGSKGDQVKGDWRESLNQEPHYNFSSAYVKGVKKREG